MFGITSIGVYIPYIRMSRSIMGKAWARGSMKGERSVANNDEDCITMAVESSLNCMRAVPGTDVDGLFFASTTAPYGEKSSSAMVATVCDLSDEMFTSDFANSLRAGTSALRSALDAVKAGSAKNVVVTAADCRLGYPRSDQEQLFGDGAAAVMVGTNRVIAEFQAYYSINDEIVDVWRNAKDTFVRTGEGRLITDEGYNDCMKTVVKGILDKTGMKAADFAKVVISTPDLRANTNIAKRTGFNPDTQVQNALMMEVGACGAAQPLMILAAALEESRPGDLILMAAYGNGAEAFIFKVTDEITKFKPYKSIQHQISNKTMLPTYEKYLSYRGLVETVPGDPFRLFPSNSVYWREQKSILRFRGSKCNHCGASIFPINRICYNCETRDDFVEIPCAEKTAKMFTYTIDKLAGRADDPTVVQSVVDAEDGTRFYCIMTDYQESEIKIGLEVEFTFRKIYEGANFNNYFWKCRPVRTIKLPADENAECGVESKYTN